MTHGRQYQWLRGIALTAVLAALSPAASLALDPPRPEALKRAGFDQKLGAQVPLETRFKDETGAEVTLAELVQGRPVILNLAYYECPMLCTLVLNGMVDAIQPLSFLPGKDYEIITISMDDREKPPLAAKKKESYLKRLDRDNAGRGWHFLTGDKDNIKAVADAIGFKFEYDPKTDQFAHASGIVVMTPAGVISHYLYGIEYPTKDLRLALVDASSGKIGSAVDQLLLLCYHYDAVAGRYTLTVMNIVRLGAAVTLGALAWFMVSMFRRENLHAARAADPVGERVRASG